MTRQDADFTAEVAENRGGNAEGQDGPGIGSDSRIAKSLLHLRVPSAVLRVLRGESNVL
jgi:hypothetical protein